MSERDAPALHACVRGIGVLGPGLPDWPSTAAVLTGEREYAPRPTVAPPPASLPSAERRRTGATVRLALAAGLEAITHADAQTAQLPTVFASSGADGTICHEICSALASAQRELSPTRFHNSVHNAASGYWSIAQRATAPSMVLCAYDGSFAAGLIEALTQLTGAGAAVLLVAHDTPYPEPLHAKRPLLESFAVALLLDGSNAAGACAHLAARLTRDAPDTLAPGPLETLRAGIPAARALPLLGRICRRDSGRTVLEYLEALQLAVSVSPCP